MRKAQENTSKYLSDIYCIWVYVGLNILCIWCKTQYIFCNLYLFRKPNDLANCIVLSWKWVEFHLWMFSCSIQVSMENEFSLSTKVCYEICKSIKRGTLRYEAYRLSFTATTKWKLHFTTDVSGFSHHYQRFHIDLFAHLFWSVATHYSLFYCFFTFFGCVFYFTLTVFFAVPSIAIWIYARM